MTNSNYKEA